MSKIQLRLEGDQQTEDAKPIVAILNATLPPGSPSTPFDAADSLNALFRERKGSADGFLWRFWDLLHDLARQLPHDGPENARLAAIVKMLHALQSIPAFLEDWGGVTSQVWRELPLFGATLREKWDGTFHPNCQTGCRVCGELSRRIPAHAIAS